MGDNEEVWRGGQGDLLVFYTYLADMIVLGRGAEGCAVVSHYYQQNPSEQIDALYGDEICPTLLENVIETLEMAKQEEKMLQP